jgi:hypothetical protein
MCVRIEVPTREGKGRVAGGKAEQQGDVDHRVSRSAHSDQRVLSSTVKFPVGVIFVLCSAVLPHVDPEARLFMSVLVFLHPSSHSRR